MERKNGSPQRQRALSEFRNSNSSRWVFPSTGIVNFLDWRLYNIRIRDCGVCGNLWWLGQPHRIPKPPIFDSASFLFLSQFPLQTLLVSSDILGTPSCCPTSSSRYSLLGVSSSFLVTNPTHSVSTRAQCSSYTRFSVFLSQYCCEPNYLGLIYLQTKPQNAQINCRTTNNV